MSLLQRLLGLLPVLFLVPSQGPLWPVAAALGGSSIQPESDATATVWSKFGLVVQKHAPGESAHTTETSGIIMRAPDPLQQIPKSSTALAPTALGKSWTQISVTQPPVRSSHLVTASAPIKLTSSGIPSSTTAKSIVSYNSSQDIRRDIPSRYQHLIGTSKPVITITFPPPRLPHRETTVRPTITTEEVVTSKRVRQYEDDDDDDEDDEDDEDEYDVDEDEDENHKVDEEEIEEIVEVQHVDSDGYGDEKPAIVKKKRRRKKKGKKNKPFKVKDFKKLRKFMLPLLLAYKLKFFTLVPLMLGGLVLIVATTGFAGFFFALFAVGLGLKGHH